MKGILADINVKGHLSILLLVWQSDAWRDLWESLAFPVQTFEDLGLDAAAKDVLIWRECQQRELVLITANRNDDGADSLEATIRTQNTPGSLPVFTLADAERLRCESAYAGRTAEKLLQYFLEIDTVRGAGRLYVP